MKIIQANSGVLTNFDVLKFLESRGASNDQKRILANVAPSEFKVYDYLSGTPACHQTRENIDEFKEKCKKYDLAEAEVLNIINCRPSSVAEIYPIIANIDLRLGDDAEELVEMVAEVFPTPEKADENGANTTNEEKIEDENDSDEKKPENDEEMNTTDGL